MELQNELVGFVRNFGMLQTERTPCGLELHISEAHALSEIATHPHITQQVLANRLRLQKSTVSRLVTQLVTRGWVQRAAHPIDRRAQTLSLTTAGRDVAERLERARTRRFEALLDALPTADRREIVRAVALLATAAASSAREQVAS